MGNVEAFSITKINHLDPNFMVVHFYGSETTAKCRQTAKENGEKEQLCSSSSLQQMYDDHHHCNKGEN